MRDTNKGGTGTITAQHCENQLAWGESKQDDVIVFDRNAPNAGGGQVDLQLHRSKNGEVASANFQATGETVSDRRTVTTTRNAQRGDSICKWGWGAISGHGTGTKQDFGCATVTNTDFCRVIEGVNYCGMNEANKGIGNPGDSGGPVFYGTGAIGFVEGGSDKIFLYTQQSRVSYMGAQILTG